MNKNKSYILAGVSILIIIGLYARFKLFFLAKKYIGQEEKTGNTGFKDQKFEKFLREYGGFYSGAAWCAIFIKAIYVYSLGNKFPELENIMTPSVHTTLANFKKDKSNKFEVLGPTERPRKGDIVVFNFSHIGMIDKVLLNGTFETIEGNTDTNGSREGVAVARKKRTKTDVKNFIRIKYKLNINVF